MLTLHWKKLVKNSGTEKNKNDLLKDIRKSKKVKEFSGETFESKNYFKNLNLTQVRMRFKNRAKMMQHVKMNFPSDPVYRKELWKCSSCYSWPKASSIGDLVTG